MLLLLLFMLIILLIIAYFVAGRDILSPSVVSIYMFIVTTLVAALNYSNWNETITEKTLLIVLMGLISFLIGELIGKSMFNNEGIKKPSDKGPLTENTKIEIKKSTIILSVIITLIVVYFNFVHTFEMARSVGYKNGSENLLYYVRIAQFDSNIDSSKHFILNFGLTYSTIISYLYIFIYLFNFLISKSKKNNFFLLIPTLINIINIVLTSGRTQFINLITFILILLFLILKYKYDWSAKLNNKFIMYGISGVFIFLLIFRLSGYLTGKSDEFSVWNNISMYMGSPIIALSKYLENPPKEFLFGSETFYSIYHILRKVGFDIPTYNLNLEFISWENVGNVNIYTAFRRYLHDFGIIGMNLMVMITGVFYGRFYSFIKRKKKLSIYTVIYSMCFFPITQIALEERFFTNLISIQGVYNLIFMVLLWKLHINNKYIKD